METKLISFMKKAILLIFFAFFYVAKGSEPSFWTVNSKSEILQGQARGVAIADDGTILLAPKLQKIFDTDQPYIWSSAIDSFGNLYIGTGNEGKVFKVDKNGKATVIADFQELFVTAIAVSKDGKIFAATSPDGKVYQIDQNGKVEIYFNPKQKYIWALAVLADSSLAVATGEKGRIYVVKKVGDEPEKSVFFQTKESHITCLTTDREGNLYAGTDPSGLVIKFSREGKPFALLDSSLREIRGLSVASDGSLYVLALSESVANLKASADQSTNSSYEAEEKAASSDYSATKPPKSKYDLSDSKAVVYKIEANGSNKIIWNSSSIAGFSIVATDDAVFIGTSDKGRIYEIFSNSGKEILLSQTDEGQVSTLIADGNRLLATSSNQGKVYEISQREKFSEGVYESRVFDAKVATSWGRIRWRANGDVVFQTRSGNTKKPDETWSNWIDVAKEGNSGRIQSPKARFFQWRVILRNPIASVSEVKVSYLPDNIAPEITSIQVLPPNIGLLPNQQFPVDPNSEVAGIDPQALGIPQQSIPPRRVFQRGAVALQWTAEDRNSDKLVYSIYYKEVGESTFKILKENMTENFYTVDGTSLADGNYVFKIVASDSPSNPPEKALTGERITEPIQIDNTAPVVNVMSKNITQNKARIIFEAVEATTYIVRAEYSINGGEWKRIYPEDGISDSQKETYILEVALDQPEISVTLRVFDLNGNAGIGKVNLKK